jgi:hypothetical protein
LILGAHPSIAAGVSRAFARGEADGCAAFRSEARLTTPRGHEGVLRRFDRSVGEPGLEVFRRLVNDPRFGDTVGVLETPYPVRFRDGIALLRSLERS